MAKAEETASTELALVDQAIVLSKEMTREKLEQIRDVLSGAVEYEVEQADSGAITADILNRMLFAESEDELNGKVKTWSSKESVGASFRFFPDGRLWPSSIVNKDTGRRGAFLSVQAMELDAGGHAAGELGVFNTSSPYIVGKLTWYASKGSLPANFQVVERGKSSGGFSILDIERWP